MWPTVDIVNGKMRVTLNDEPALDDIRPEPDDTIHIGDMVHVEFREGEYKWLAVQEIEYDDVLKEQVFYCVGKHGTEYEVYLWEMDEVDRSLRSKLGEH
jgi:hypothetical protein